MLKSFLREHQVKPPSIFILYLSEIWRELSIYSSNSNNGILPFAFSKFFPLPGLINKRLFNVFDTDQDGYLSPKEFIKGLSIVDLVSMNLLLLYLNVSLHISRKIFNICVVKILEGYFSKNNPRLEKK